jgi:hypothetical protein
MNLKKLLALAGASIVLAGLSAGAALAASGPTVKVRVEGLNKTLLDPTKVTTHTGWITRGGTPRGKCSRTSAAGALDKATRHRWGGFWDRKYAGLEVTSILGELHRFTSSKYWSVWVDNKYAPSGVCGLHLHRGEQLLFAAVPDTPQEFPIGMQVPRKVVAGQPFEVKVVAFDGTGKSRPLAGAMVTAGGISSQPIPHSQRKAKTNAQGMATLTEDQPGLIVLNASRNGYIRAARVVRDVS